MTNEEWAIGYRLPNGEVRITPRYYSTREEAEEWFDYLCGPWREELEQKAAEEEAEEKQKGRMTTNWARMTLKEKRKGQHILLVREVTPYTIKREAPEWS